MERSYKVGTRASPLALRQVEEVLENLRRFHPWIKTDIVTIETTGDRDRSTPISEIEGSDFFTREIDQALLEKRIDFAVHSAKDLPEDLRDGLTVSAITSCIDPYEALVSRSGLKLEELPYGAKIGTGSLRRKNGLKRFRPDFQIVDIRGNIEERLKLQDLDDIVIAACGLIRLGLEEKITQRIPFDIIKPHPLQGRLAVVTRLEDTDLIKLISVIGQREEGPV